MTNLLRSDYRQLGPVVLPYRNRQSYMHTFDITAPIMQTGFEDYLEPVSILLAASGIRNGIAHMTVDEKIVKAGASQRRPKPHVDGCFMPQSRSWSHPQPGWLHYCNDIRRGPVARMPVIVAASAIGCRAWRGDFIGSPKEDGDLSHIAAQLLGGKVLQPNVGYLLSADCVHESMILAVDTRRTFLRIALPVGSAF